jgi:hypothetical protein
MSNLISPTDVSDKKRRELEQALAEAIRAVNSLPNPTCAVNTAAATAATTSVAATTATGGSSPDSVARGRFKPRPFSIRRILRKAKRKRERELTRTEAQVARASLSKKLAAEALPSVRVSKI